MAWLNIHQKELNKLKKKAGEQLKTFPIKTVVCDGVTIGFRMKHCCIFRPWEAPHDLSVGSGQECHFTGSCIENYCMIHHEKSRLILSRLAQGHDVPRDEFQTMQSWIHTNRKELLPYICVQEVRFCPALFCTLLQTVTKSWTKQCQNHGPNSVEIMDISAKMRSHILFCAGW
jgi:hypothetical protein